jgi:glutamate-1-semialdehyde 2,1-aminomutase
MAAGIAALEQLSEGRVTRVPKSEMKSGTRVTRPSETNAYSRLEELGSQLEAGMRDAARSAGIAMTFNRCGSMFCGYFTGGPVWNLADAMKSDRERFKKFFHGMLADGIYLAPSQFEAGFISTAHTAADIGRTVKSAAKALRRL